MVAAWLAAGGSTVGTARLLAEVMPGATVAVAVVMTVGAMVTSAAAAGSVKGGGDGAG